MTEFFIPELDPDGVSAEAVYAGFKKDALARTGHQAREDRIFKLSARREGADCEAEVGKPDPVCGETVLAIVDLGRGRPYVIHCGSPSGLTKEVVVEKPVYAATEFTGS